MLGLEVVIAPIDIYIYPIKILFSFISFTPTYLSFLNLISHTWDFLQNSFHSRSKFFLFQTGWVCLRIKEEKGLGVVLLIAESKSGGGTYLRREKSHAYFIPSQLLKNWFNKGFTIFTIKATIFGFSYIL